MPITRRHFAIGALSAASWYLFPSVSLAGQSETRLIPSTGEVIPVVGMGTWITFNVGNDPELLKRSTNVTETFLKEGGGMIDSSPMYGSSQDTIGHALKSLSSTGRLFSADKVWTSGKAAGVDQIEETRTRWGVPKFDLLQVHNLVDWEAHLETLFAMKEQGSLRYAGITTSHGRRHADLERIMATQPIDFVQLTYNVVDREVEQRLLPLAIERGIAVIVNRPYQRGALINRFEGKPLPQIASEYGAETWAQLLLKFVISHPAVTVAIPATTKPSHLIENKNAARTRLPEGAERDELLSAIASA